MTRHYIETKHAASSCLSFILLQLLNLSISFCLVLIKPVNSVNNAILSMLMLASCMAVTAPLKGPQKEKSAEILFAPAVIRHLQHS